MRYIIQYLPLLCLFGSYGCSSAITKLEILHGVVLTNAIFATYTTISSKILYYTSNRIDRDYYRRFYFQRSYYLFLYILCFR